MTNYFASDVKNIFYIMESIFRNKIKIFILIVIFVGVIILSFIYGEELFSIVFGEQWKLSGRYVGVLLLLFVSETIIYPFVGLMPLFGKQKVYFMLELFKLFFVLLSILICFLLKLDVVTYINIHVISMLLSVSISGAFSLSILIKNHEFEYDI